MAKIPHPIAPAPKPDFGLYVGILFGVLSVIFFVLQSNGVEVNWLWSALIYVACTGVAVWTTLKHALPNRGRMRIAVVTAIVLICTMLGSVGTKKQYRKDRPARPTVAALPKNKGQDKGGKVTMTGWGGMPGGKVFANATVESPPAPSLHLHMALIARVQDSAVDEMEDTSIEKSSLREVVGQTIEIAVSKQFQARVYRLKFAKAILVLLPGTVEADQISKLSDVLQVGGTIMINNGFVWPVFANSPRKTTSLQQSAEDGGIAIGAHANAGGAQQCEAGSICNQDSQINAPQVVYNNQTPPLRITWTQKRQEGGNEKWHFEQIVTVTPNVTWNPVSLVIECDQVVKYALPEGAFFSPRIGADQSGKRVIASWGTPPRNPTDPISIEVFSDRDFNVVGVTAQ